MGCPAYPQGVCSTSMDDTMTTAPSSVPAPAAAPAAPTAAATATATATTPAASAVDATYGYHDRKDALDARLARIEGQVRGIRRMVSEDQYCIDVLVQVSAATKALRSLALQLLDDHVRHCVRDAIESGGESEADEKLTEALAAVARLVKS